MTATYRARPARPITPGNLALRILFWVGVVAALKGFGVVGYSWPLTFAVGFTVGVALIVIPLIFFFMLAVILNNLP